MILGTHNSLSYNKPKKWWMKIGLPIAKCQSKSLIEQYNNGARCFDLRFKFDNEELAYTAHGLVDFKADIYTDIHQLKDMATADDPIYIRLTLEAAKENSFQEKCFIAFCKEIETFDNIICFNGTRKFDWKTIYDFKFKPNVIQLVGSMQSTYGKIWPWLWTKLNKKKVKKQLEELKSTDKIVLVDFI